MRSTKFLSYILLFAVVAAAACGGSHSSVAPLPPVRHPNAGAMFVIKIPTRAPAINSHHVKPHYISPSTQSVSITVNAQPSPVIANLTPTSPNCTPANGQNPLTCTVSVPAPVGADTFTQVIYDGQNATGNQLSTATTNFTIIAGQQNTIPVTLNGIISSIILVLANPTPPQGTATTIPLAVTAKDADGNIILNPGGYNNPITLTDSDSTYTSVSPTNDSDPSTVVTVSYNGGPLLSATFSAIASGVSPENITNAVLTPASQCSPPPNQTTACEDVRYSLAGQFVALPTVEGFQSSIDLPGNNQTGSPNKAHVTVSTVLPTGLPPFSQQNPILYFSMTTPVTTQLNGNSEFGIQLPSGYPTSNTLFYIAFYDPNNSGAGWQPMEVMSLAGNSLSFSPLLGSVSETLFVNQTIGYALYPVADGATPAPQGRLFLASGSQFSEFAPGASGNAAPIAVVSGSNTTLSPTGPLAFDTSGNIYVPNNTYITVFASNANGNVAPIRTIGGGNTLINNTSYIAVDSAGYLYVNSYDPIKQNYVIEVFAPGANGNVAPTREFNSIGRTSGLGVDSGDNLYVASEGNDEIYEYAPNVSGTPQPIRALQPTGGDQLVGVAIDPANSVYTSYYSSGGPTGTINVFASGSTVPTTLIDGPFSGNSNYPVAADPAGYIYAPEDGVVVEFAPGASGAVVPVRELGPIPGSYVSIDDSGMVRRNHGPFKMHPVKPKSEH